MYSLWLLLIAVVAAAALRQVTERANFAKRNDLKQLHRSDRNLLHTCVFTVKLRNMDVLEEMVDKISDPFSEIFGRHMTRQEVADLTANPEASRAVLDFLSEHGIQVVKQSLYGEIIHAQASIEVWEHLLEAEFHVFQNSGGQGVHRSLRYSIPSQLQTHVQSILNTVQMPVQFLARRPTVRTASQDGYVTPSLLNSFYSIPSNVGNSLGSQCVYATVSQNFSPLDLANFQTINSIPLQPVSTVIGGHNSSQACLNSYLACIEGNLDVQYLMAVSQVTPTVYYYDDSSVDFMATWTTKLLSMSSPPLVNSISYGVEEAQMAASSLALFDSTVRQLSAMGVTIVAGSGDDGVAGSAAKKDASKCGYKPYWPTSSPYVLSIGGTQGPESGKPEIACSADTGGEITTGGGFSNVYGRPWWQKAQVDEYFRVVGTQPVPGYNTSGRGFPDVSVMGFNYDVIIGGEVYGISGTSAATPVVAGLVALVNAARLKMGRPALGWINPALYSNSSFYAMDITVGNNKCTAGNTSAICCEEGFYTAPGWDPVTGLGTIYFPGFFDLLVNLGYSYTPRPTSAPSVSPTPAPSSPPVSRRPTRAPTIRPTRSPLQFPTSQPSRAPVVSQPATPNSTNIVPVVAGVVVVVLFLLCIGCVSWRYCSKRGDMRLLDQNDMELVDIENEFRRRNKNDDDYGDEVFNAMYENNESENEDEGANEEEEEEEDADQAALDALLFSAEANEYDENSAGYFDSVYDNMSGGTAKRNEDETALENALFSAEANEYGQVVTLDLPLDNLKTRVDPELENALFSAESNEYGALKINSEFEAESRRLQELSGSYQASQTPAETFDVPTVIPIDVFDDMISFSHQDSPHGIPTVVPMESMMDPSKPISMVIPSPRNSPRTTPGSTPGSRGAAAGSSGPSVFTFDVVTSTPSPLSRSASSPRTTPSVFTFDVDTSAVTPHRNTSSPRSAPSVFTFDDAAVSPRESQHLPPFSVEALASQPPSPRYGVNGPSRGVTPTAVRPSSPRYADPYPSSPRYADPYSTQPFSNEPTVIPDFNPYPSPYTQHLSPGQLASSTPRHQPIPPSPSVFTFEDPRDLISVLPAESPRGKRVGFQIADEPDLAACPAEPSPSSSSSHDHMPPTPPSPKATPRREQSFFFDAVYDIDPTPDEEEEMELFASPFADVSYSAPAVSSSNPINSAKAKASPLITAGSVFSFDSVYDSELKPSEVQPSDVSVQDSFVSGPTEWSDPASNSTTADLKGPPSSTSSSLGQNTNPLSRRLSVVRKQPNA